LLSPRNLQSAIGVHHLHASPVKLDGTLTLAGEIFLLLSRSLDLDPMDRIDSLK
jgi:hypothetical protein